MNVITRPTVELIAGMEFYGHSFYAIPADGDDLTKLCSFAAKGCYDSFGERGRSNTDNQKQIISSRHGSVLEHAYATLFITGITRALSLELNRHRHFNISQRSTRYTAEEDCAIVLDPYYASLYDRKKNDPAGMSIAEYELLNTHINAASRAIQQYQDEVSRLIGLNPRELEGVELRKWARGKARNILPHALETRGTWTGNIRTWRHFIEMRSERFAEAEIRRLADAVFQVLYQWAPLYFDDYYSSKLVDEIPEYQTEYRKV